MDQREERWLTGARTHGFITMSLAVILLVVGVLAAIGVIGVPTAAPLPPGPSPVRSGSSEPAEPWVRAVPNTDFLSLLGDEVTVFEFKGAHVNAWLEVEIGGKTSRMGEQLGNFLAEGMPPKTVPSGYILWSRPKTGAKEVWRLALGVRDKSGNLGRTAIDDHLLPPGSGIAPGSRATYGGNAYAIPDKQNVYTLHTIVDHLESDQAKRKVDLKCKFVARE